MKNDKPFQLIIAGFGGQGILFSGKLLAQSALHEDRNVTWFPSYGAEIRGGTANCTVIISKEMIGSPVVRCPDILLIMNQASMDKFEPLLKPKGLLVMNTSLIARPASRTDIKTVRVNATDIAKNLGSPQSANLVMLGALIGNTGVIKPDSVYSAMKQIIPAHRKKSIPLNRKAFKRGLEEVAR